MPLTIEDGTIVDGANSYVTLTEVRDYAEQRGLTLPTEDTDLEHLIVRGFDYLESLTYKGYPVEALQPSQFPRSNIYIYGEELPDDSIPLDLKKANCQLAFEANSTDLLPTSSGAPVVREKVDVVEVEYSDTGTSSNSPSFKSVNALLRDLLANGHASNIKVIRA